MPKFNANNEWIPVQDDLMQWDSSINSWILSDLKTYMGNPLNIGKGFPAITPVMPTTRGVALGPGVPAGTLNYLNVGHVNIDGTLPGVGEPFGSGYEPIKYDNSIAKYDQKGGPRSLAYDPAKWTLGPFKAGDLVLMEVQVKARGGTAYKEEHVVFGVNDMAVSPKTPIQIAEVPAYRWGASPLGTVADKHFDYVNLFMFEVPTGATPDIQVQIKGGRELTSAQMWPQQLSVCIIKEGP